LPVEFFARRCAPALILVFALAGCIAHQPIASGAGTAIVANGPAADYPMAVGDPYRIGAILYTPADVMNYDEVGHAAADSGVGVTGSHHTLPLPSYVEVTSLTTGKTVLVRLVRRGPMDGDALIALSPAAFAQLGASPGEPVRVRRVNPPEEERAALRAGRTAPPRMDTPASLLAVLKRKLPGEGSATLMSKPAPVAVASVAVPPSSIPQARTSAAVTSPSDSRAAPAAAARLEQAEPRRAAVEPKSRPAAKAGGQKGTFIVQAAAMSTLERAQKVAGAIGGSVSRAGRYFRVRTGPFATRAQAEASLAKVRAAGYSDARISTNG